MTLLGPAWSPISQFPHIHFWEQAFKAFLFVSILLPIFPIALVFYISTQGVYVRDPPCPYCSHTAYVPPLLLLILLLPPVHVCPASDLRSSLAQADRTPCPVQGYPSRWQPCRDPVCDDLATDPVEPLTALNTPSIFRDAVGRFWKTSP